MSCASTRRTSARFHGRGSAGMRFAQCRTKAPPAPLRIARRANRSRRGTWETRMKAIRRNILWMALLCAAAGFTPGSAFATTNVEECAQAAEFIGNAARARDAGMPRDDFLAHMQSDLEVIRSFPPE